MSEDVTSGLEAFWARVPGGAPVDARARTDAEARLLARVEAARRARPTVRVPTAAFLAHLGAQVAGAGPDGLEAVHVEDLWLAFACGIGDAEAHRALGAEHLPAAAAMARTVDASPSFVDEVLQQLREKVLVAAPGRTPRILDYAGRGSLDHWLRAAALRLALNARRSAKRQPEPLTDAAALELKAPSVDVGLGILRDRYGAAFQKAVRAGFDGLLAEERSVLRLHFRDGLSTNQIAAMYQVNKSTISRRMSRARERLLDETRTRLEEDLALPASEVESLLGALGPKLEMNLSSVLATMP